MFAEKVHPLNLNKRPNQSPNFLSHCFTFRRAKVSGVKLHVYAILKSCVMGWKSGEALSVSIVTSCHMVFF